jgi:hypothetical protein
VIGASIRAAIVVAVAAAAIDRILGRLAPEAAARPIESFVVIEAPIGDVWSELANIEKQPLWMTDLKAVRLLTPPPVGLGTRADGTVRILGVPIHDPVTVTAFEPPIRFGIRHDGRFSGDGMISLEAGVDGRSTIVRWRERLVPPLLPYVGALLQWPVLREVLQADLHRLRRLFEG